MDEPKTPEYIPPEDNDFDEAPSPPDHHHHHHIHQSPEHSPEAMTPPPPQAKVEPSVTAAAATESKSSTLGKVWSGKVTLPEAQSFSANGYIISGTMEPDIVKNSLPPQIRVGGKLDFDVVDKGLVFF